MEKVKKVYSKYKSPLKDIIISSARFIGASSALVDDEYFIYIYCKLGIKLLNWVYLIEFYRNWGSALKLKDNKSYYINNNFSIGIYLKQKKRNILLIDLDFFMFLKKYKNLTDWDIKEYIMFYLMYLVIYRIKIILLFIENKPKKWKKKIKMQKKLLNICFYSTNLIKKIEKKRILKNFIKISPGALVLLWFLSYEQDKSLVKFYYNKGICMKVGNKGYNSYFILRFVIRDVSVEKHYFYYSNTNMKIVFLQKLIVFSSKNCLKYLRKKKNKKSKYVSNILFKKKLEEIED